MFCPNVHESNTWTWQKVKKSFGDIDLIFKVTLENQIAKFRRKFLNAHYLRSGSVDFTQICMNSISGHDNKPIKFWRP